MVSAVPKLKIFATLVIFLISIIPIYAPEGDDGGGEMGASGGFPGGDTPKYKQVSDDDAAKAIKKILKVLMNILLNK